MRTPQSLLGQRLTGAVRLRAWCIVALLLDFLDTVLVPVRLGVLRSGRLREIRYDGSNTGRDDDALNVRAEVSVWASGTGILHLLVLLDALQDTSGTLDGGADEFLRIGHVEVEGTGSVRDGLNALDSFVEDTILLSDRYCFFALLREAPSAFSYLPYLTIPAFPAETRIFLSCPEKTPLPGYFLTCYQGCPPTRKLD